MTRVTELKKCCCNECEIPDIEMTDKDIMRISEFYKAFSDPTRLRILYKLSTAQPLDVGCIAQSLEMTDSAVSHQLKVLRQQRLVTAERKGKFVYYSLDDAHIGSMLSAALEHIKEDY